MQPDYQNPWLDQIPLHNHPVAPETYQTLFRLMAREFVRDDPGSALLMRAALLQILHHLHREATEGLTPELWDKSPHYARLTQVVDFIHSHFTEELSLPLLAQVAAMDRFHFHKVFVRHLHQTPVQYVRRLRLERAKDLLMHSSLSLTEVASACGIPNVPYFGKVFLRHAGMTPGDYRRRHQYG